MPQNTTITLVPDAWTQLTNANVSAIRVQNLASPTSAHVWIMATAGEVAPTSLNGAIRLLPNQAIGADLILGNLFPGVTNPTRVYAYSADAVQVSVSHA